MTANIPSSIFSVDISPEEYFTDVHDRVADAYYGKMGIQFMRETQQRIHWVCGNVLGNKILDVGCSQGIAAVLLGREGKRVTVIDTTQRSIDQAKKYLEQESLQVRKNISFAHGDFLTSDFDEGSFETILIVEVLEHLLQPELFIEAASQYLVENGRLIITVPFGISDFIDHKHTYYLLEPYRLMSRRFEIVEVMLFGKWLGLVGRRRATGEKIPSIEKLGDNLVKQLEATFLKLEHELRGDAAGLRTRLNDAAVQHQTIVRQVRSLNQQIAEDQSAQRKADSALVRLQQELTLSEQSLVQVRAELTSTSLRARHEHVLHLESQAIADAQCLTLTSRHAEALSAHRRNSEQIQSEQIQLAQFTVERDATRQIITDLTVRLAVAQHDRIYLSTRLAAADRRTEIEHQATRAEVARLTILLDSQRETRHEDEKRLIRVGLESQSIYTLLKDTQDGHCHAPKEVERVRQELDVAPLLREPNKNIALLETRAPEMLLTTIFQQPVFHGLHVTRVADNESPVQISLEKPQSNATNTEKVSPLSNATIEYSGEPEQHELNTIVSDVKTFTSSADNIPLKTGTATAPSSIVEVDRISAGAQLGIEKSNKSQIALQTDFSAMQSRFERDAEEIWELASQYETDCRQLQTRLIASDAQALTQKNRIDVLETQQALEQSDREENDFITVELRKSLLDAELLLALTKTGFIESESRLELKYSELRDDHIAVEALTHIQAAQISALESQRSVATVAREKFESVTVGLRESLKKAQGSIELAKVQSEKMQVKQELQNSGFFDQLQALTQSKLAADTTLSQLGDEISSAKLRFNEVHRKYRATVQKETILKANLASREATLQKVTSQHQSLCVEVEESRKVAVELQTTTDLKSQKARDTADKLQISFTGMTAREQRYKEKIIELEVIADKIVHLDQRVRIAEREKASADKRADDAKKTLSYQLGYMLLQAPKSWSGIIQLPSDIIKLRVEAKLRRDAKLLKSKRQFFVDVPEGTLEIQSIVQIPSEFQTPARPQQSLMRIASVMDEFTFHSYNPECELLQLHPDTCIEQLTEFKPDLLFIESAWKGLDGLWQTKISNNGVEINQCIAWCNANKVPTMFWNKEDPVHFSTFIPLAKQIDYIFTTDIDCIPKYKHAVGHDRVFLLPFAAQPKTHNPVELFERKDSFNFAGSYYLRYPERQRDFSALIDTVKAFKTVEIYDRNFDNPHPHYTFPDAYKSIILGVLPFDEIDKAYKGYRYGINMNTIKQSQTMFARRVFELLASNTVVVSNFSRGVRLLFGDLVITSDDATQLRGRLESICTDDVNYRKLRLMGLRKVMTEHTYAHRLGYIRAKLWDTAYKPQFPSVAVFAIANSVDEQDQLICHFQRQNHTDCTLYLFRQFGGTPSAANAAIHEFSDLASFNNALKTILLNTPLLALFVPQDYYGPQYLVDLSLASTYTTAQAFGKLTQYQAKDAYCYLQQPGHQYRPTNSLPARAAMVLSAALPTGWIDECIARPATASLTLDNMLAIDEFNYCRDGATVDATVLRETVDDSHVANQGTSFAHVLSLTAESLNGSAGPLNTDDGLPQISAEMLFKLIPQPTSKQLQLSFKEDSLHLQSTLPVDKHGYIYANKNFTRAELNLVLNSQFRLKAESTIPDLRTIFEFQDVQGRKISHAMNGAVGGKHALAIPNQCTTIRFGLRVQGPGKMIAERLVLGDHGERPAAIAGNSSYLVLTKQYPAYDDLYRYGFLHSRVRAYKEHGLLVDVFRISDESGQVYREFEGIDVASGNAKLLDDTLQTGRYKHVLVHMLDENMWRILEKHCERVKVTVWVHGAEIQAWQRRTFEFDRMTADSIARQKKLSAKRLKFWRTVLNNVNVNLNLVFVSKTFMREVESDLGVPLVRENVQVSVIHNYVDSRIFSYQEKTLQHRCKILSVRSFASRKYGNDLTVAAILELSKRPIFHELQFHIVGDGELYNETVLPLKKFSNVKLDRKFLTHRQIAELQKDYGIFLNPTRWDSQGVSRDEAMSSGLVPITTSVAAIPEFVDMTCGVVVPAEDYVAIADAIEFLYLNPNEFFRLSKAASERVKEQCGFHKTINEEIRLIQKPSR